MILLNISGQTSLIFLVGCIYIVCAPFTKVEESFGLQAVHDFLFLSKPGELPSKISTFISAGYDFEQLSQVNDSSIEWDHLDFPGVVHRTFINSFVVSLLAKPIQIINLVNDKFAYQILSRVCLLCWFTFAFKSFLESISRTKGLAHTQMITLLTLSQFHMLFYASRTLPNTFASIFMLLAYAAWIEQRFTKLLLLTAFTVLVVRFETIILFGCILAIEVFYTRQLKLWTVLLVGIPSGILSLLTTVVFDSYMWNKLVWPEGDTILFNIYENKSHLYGTQPFLWYFYSVAPRLLLSSIVFVFLRPKQFANKYAVVAFLYVLAYSWLPHKELRFVIYSLPLVNICVADGITQLLIICQNNAKTDPVLNRKNQLSSSDAKHSNLKRRNIETSIQKENPLKLTEERDPPINWKLKWAKRLVILAIYGHLIVNFVVSLFLLYISANNYPGGNAVLYVNRDINLNHARSTERVSVYVTNLAAQTGFSRFLQLDHVAYNKQPQLTLDQHSHFDYIYLILELDDHNKYLRHCSQNEQSVKCSLSLSPNYRCTLIKRIMAFDRVNLDRTHFEVAMKNYLNIFKCSRSMLIIE